MLPFNLLVKSVISIHQECQPAQHILLDTALATSQGQQTGLEFADPSTLQRDSFPFASPPLAALGWAGLCPLTAGSVTEDRDLYQFLL